MSTDKVKVSIIIPVYNCEPYLEQCLNSVLQQTLKDLEILCVDDGSTDGSPIILETYTKMHKKIHAFSQKNQGAGAARNLGLEHAVGEFIAFLDGDDFYFHKDALEKMYAACKKNQVAVCGSYGKILEGNLLREAGFYNTQNLHPEGVYSYSDFQMDCGYTTFLFEKQLLDQYKLEFPLYRRFQDPPFLVKAMYYAGKFTMADTFLYCYRAPNLIRRLTPEKTVDMLRGMLDNLIFACEHQLKLLFEETMEHLECDYCYMILHSFTPVPSKTNNDILFLLQALNDRVRDHLQNKTYMLRPLQMLMIQSAAFNGYYEELLEKRIQSLEYIVVYGAGRYAKNFLKYLEQKGYLPKVVHIVVSSTKDNESQLFGISVIDLDTFIQKQKGETVFIAMSTRLQKAVEKSLVERKYFNYESMDDAFLGKIG